MTLHIKAGQTTVVHKTEAMTKIFKSDDNVLGLRHCRCSFLPRNKPGLWVAKQHVSGHVSGPYIELPRGVNAIFETGTE